MDPIAVAMLANLSVDVKRINENLLLLAPELPLIDLSSATEDYLLQPYCIAIINFSNTTTVPLHIATPADSYYELHIIPSNTGGTSGATDSPIYLLPNNTTYTNAFWVAEYWRNSNSHASAYTDISAFKIGQAFSAIVAWITNRTQYKNVRAITDVYGISTGWATIRPMSTDWRDTTTPWTSLGTIVFPQNSSGTIIIFRLR
jgi:hypothetical protein